MARVNVQARVVRVTEIARPVRIITGELVRVQAAGKAVTKLSPERDNSIRLVQKLKFPNNSIKQNVFCTLIQQCQRI
jgi:hypothetical protein